MSMSFQRIRPLLLPGAAADSASEASWLRSPARLNAMPEDGPWVPSTPATATTQRDPGRWRRQLASLAPYRLPALLAVVLVLAYHQAFVDLLNNMQANTPLAYTALVPPISLILGWIALRRTPKGKENVDRDMDHFLGFQLILFAIALTLVPQFLPKLDWLQRTDILSMPIFVAGLILLAYGAAVVRRLLVPILFLFLAWPVPYVTFLNGALAAVTNATSAAVAVVAAATGVATPNPADNTLFTIHGPQGQFLLSIGSACAGADSMIGYLIVGLAAMSVIQGRLSGRLGWLIGGILFSWCANVGRIVAIFLFGRSVGEGLALTLLHSVLGLIIFNAVLLIMLALAPRLGLHLAPLEQRVRIRLPQRPKMSRFTVASTFASAFLIGLFSVYDVLPTSSYAGSIASLSPISQVQPKPAGWSVHYVGTVDWATLYFGASSVWEEFAYVSKSGQVVWLSSQRANPRRLATYGIEACYNYHGYKLFGQRSVDLGNGVTAQIINYDDTTNHNEWVTLYWTWPIHQGQGNQAERVILQVRQTDNLGAGGSAVTGSDIGQELGAVLGVGNASPNPSFATADNTVINLGQQLVAKVVQVS